MTPLPPTRGTRRLTGVTRIARGTTATGRRWARREYETECACSTRAWMTGTQWRACADRCRSCEGARRYISPAAAAERLRTRAA